MAAHTYRYFLHRDGSKQAYNILGAHHLGTPVVFVNGMSMLMSDWERLSVELAKTRPVLVFDHRGMGQSTLSRRGNEQVTLELMARDLADLLQGLNWTEVALCGYSMGGAVIQQLLLLPWHPSNPYPLHVNVTHVIMAATPAESLYEKPFTSAFENYPPPKDGVRWTALEKEAAVRPIVESIFDPQWIKQNPGQFARSVEGMTRARPLRTILMQAHAMGEIDFDKLHRRLPRETQFLVVHGKRDQVVPYSESKKILRRIPWAREVSVGTCRGQVPNLEFGHHWFEYFSAEVWTGVIEEFLFSVAPIVQARL